MRAMVLVACAACGFNAPSVPDGGSDSPAADRDSDGDGIVDAADLCPDDPAPEQRDHDRDLRGDRCDRCPHLADPVDPDQDNDGVGDACDPAPAVTGDRRALWIGFYPEDATELASFSRWRQFGGAWSITTDGWVQGVVSGIGVLQPVMALQRPIIASRIRLDEVSATEATAGVISGLVFAGTSLRQLYQCALFKNQTRIGARSINNGATVADNYEPWPGTIAGGVTVDVVSRFAGGMFECNYTMPLTTVRSPSTATSGAVEFVVRDATVSYDYLFVVDEGS